MDHHRHVHVVEVPEPQQFGLAAQELELPGPRLLHPPRDVAVLFRRHGEEHHAPGKVLKGLGAYETHGCAQHARHLRVVTAGMSRARLRVGDRMSGHHQPVELAQEREGRPVGFATRLAAHARDGEPALGSEPDLAHGLLDQLRGLELLEAELGTLPDRFTEGDDLLALPVDGLADRALDVVECGHHVSFEERSCDLRDRPQDRPRASRNAFTASAGRPAPRTAPMTATPAAPARVTSGTRAGVIPPTARTGTRTADATRSRAGRPCGGPY